ncbi:MAG: hypothetical protein MR627_03360 [Prevotella sp.]|nr:hypothetical protein [Prevotella sp.]
MKRLSTSLLIFILALLAVPERMWAWTSVEFRASFDGWATGHTMTRNDANSFTYEFAASKDFTFKFYVSDGVKWVGSYNTNFETVSNYDGSFEYLCSNINGGGSDITFKVNPKYSKYKIDLLWDNQSGNNHYFKYTVTGITEGGSSDPVSKYKLMKGDGTNKGTQVATFTGTNFPYTATYNIDAAGTYYFYVNDGSKDYLNADKAFSDRTKIALYQYGTSNYSHAIKLEATTTGTYTFTFAQETSDYSITCTYPTSTGEDTYNLVYLVDKTLNDEWLHTWLEGGAIDKDITDWNSRPKIGSDDFPTTTKYKNTDYYTKTFSVNKTTADSYKQIGVKIGDNGANLTSNVITSTWDNVQYIIVTSSGVNIVETSTEPIDPNLGTSSNGKAYYLATEESGPNSIFGTKATKTTEDNTVTYSRILRFNDNGDGSYELNIPATISGNVWILEIDKQNNKTTYRPVEAVAVGSSNPTNNNSINGNFGGSGTSKVFTLTDRGDVDGIYNIKLNLNKSGIPAKWTITHDPLTRVAYYLSTASMSSASPVYDKRANTTDAFSNRFIGTNYFNEDSNVDYYVISNILKGNDYNYVSSAKNFDTSVAANSNWNVITTVNKLLLLGNGGLAFSNQKPNNEFSPNELPMKSSDLLKGLCAVEYNPSTGDNDKAVETTHYGIRGQIIVRQDISSTETTSMKIFGPLVAASVKSDGEWDPAYSYEEGDLTNGISSNNVMKFDETENCYTITIVTNNEQQGKHFRFIRNGKLDNTWTEDETKARIPYYDNSATDSSAATVADPNYVNYGGSATNRDFDILFNRPAGKWTIKFYIVNEASSDGNTQSKYYYTINAEDNFKVEIPSALNKVLRTYSYGSDVKPQEENVHVYVAHSFGPAKENDQYTNTKTGTVHLYEINYVPANTGVVLYCGEGMVPETVTFVEANEYNVTDYAASKTDKKKLWKNRHEGEDDFNNDLEPVLARTFVDNSVKDESGDIIARNFCMSQFSKTNTGKELTEKGTAYDDYIGFFRVKSYISDNKAYLQYGTDIINENAQIFGQDTDGKAVSGGAKLAMVFEGFEDDNVVTGISDNLSAKPVLTDDAYYNLQGMRVEKPVKGIYIHNGKKVVIK